MAALRAAAGREKPGSNAAQALQAMIANAEAARADVQPLCQDTGSLLFFVDAPAGMVQQDFRAAAAAAVEQATADGLLRQNCVETLTGRNTGNNLGKGSPSIHWLESQREDVELFLILKGGGCENVGAQYSLPDAGLGAGRDLEGVRRCCLDAVFRAQGRGCAPGVLSVCIGGDRESGYAESKRQLLRRLGSRSVQPELAKLEEQIWHEANTLGIGPMGYGGAVTLLDVFASTLHRLPASYFVSISYMCWSFRRHGLVAAPDGSIRHWLA